MGARGGMRTPAGAPRENRFGFSPSGPDGGKVIHRQDMRRTMIAPDTSPLGILSAALGLLAGLVLTFSGYRLAKGLAGLAGFLVGVVVGLSVGGVYAGPVGALVGAIVLGIAFALLFRFAFRFAGAVVGVFAGVAIGSAFAWPAWGIVLAAVAGGVLGLVLNKIAIVVATVLVGAQLAVNSAVELFYDTGDLRFTQEALVVLASTVVLAALGALSQMRSLRGEDDLLGARRRGNAT